MLPFCGYHVAEYIDHWLKMGRTLANPPRIFSVNWFRKDENGKFVWPGFGENMRMLKWIVERCKGRAGATESVLGWMPRRSDIDWTGFARLSDAQYAELMSVDRELWIKELALHETLFESLRDKLPKELPLKRELLLATLSRSPASWAPTV